MAHRLFRKSVLAVGMVGALVLAGCSSSDSGTTVENSASSGENGRGPITYAMGKVDSEKLLHIIEKWNADHPDALADRRAHV